MTDIIYPPAAYCCFVYGFDPHRVKRSMFDTSVMWCTDCLATIIAVPWPDMPWPGMFVNEHLVVEWP